MRVFIKDMKQKRLKSKATTLYCDDLLAPCVRNEYSRDSIITKQVFQKILPQSYINMKIGGSEKPEESQDEAADDPSSSDVEPPPVKKSKSHKDKARDTTPPSKKSRATPSTRAPSSAPGQLAKKVCFLFLYGTGRKAP